ncbi:MAG TPA: hypothetical protein VEB87_07095 [Nitrososphaerales archaeon]|nr:hypothetical protein [Nitrososphaerales archaeon]
MQIETPKLWFDSASSALHLPRTIGYCLLGVVPAAILWCIGIGTRIATDFTGYPPVSLPLLLVNVVYLLLASQLIHRRTLQLGEYTKSLGVEVESDQLGRLTSLKGIMMAWALLLCLTSLVIDPYVYNLYYPPLQAAMRLVVTGYLRFIQATFLWTLGCSMYLIYKWGKLPIRLKSFAEDRTLGLNVYGRASLLFVTLYIVAMLLTFPIFVYKSDAVVWSEAAFSLLGLAIFAVPLFSLRERLVGAKKEKLAWITRRHARAIESIESCGDGPIDAVMVNELIAVDRIRTDLQHISGWPFNAGVVVRLFTVVFVPLFLVLVSVYLTRALNL